MKGLCAALLVTALLFTGCSSTVPSSSTEAPAAEEPAAEEPAAEEPAAEEPAAEEPAAEAPALDFPTKTVTLVVHTDPGGGADVFARQFGKYLQDKIGQTVIIDNRAGGSGAIALDYAAKAKPDGYTLLTITDTMIMTPLNTNVPTDLSSFTPVARLLVDPSVIYVKSDSDYTLESLLDELKNGDKKLNWATDQAGTPNTILVDNMVKQANLQINAVPLGDGSKAVTSVLSGDCVTSISEYTEILPQLEAGEFKIIGVVNSERIPALGDIPTLAESGYPDYYIDKFRGFVVPNGTPPEVIAYFEEAFQEVLEDPEYKELYTNNLQNASFQGSEELKATIAEKTEFYRKGMGLD